MWPGQRATWALLFQCYIVYLIQVKILIYQGFTRTRLDALKRTLLGMTNGGIAAIAYQGKLGDNSSAGEIVGSFTKPVELTGRQTRNGGLQGNQSKKNYHLQPLHSSVSAWATVPELLLCHRLTIFLDGVQGSETDLLPALPTLPSDLQMPKMYSSHTWSFGGQVTTVQKFKLSVSVSVARCV